MKKFYVIFISVVLFFGCNTVQQERIYVKKPEIKRIPKPVKLICNMPDIPLIDNFEGDILLWEIKTNGEAGGKINIINDGNENKVVHLIYKINYSSDNYSPHAVTIIYTRKMNFSNYKGIKFYASGTPTVSYKLKVFEIENYWNENRKEIWCKSFKVSQKWKVYRIPFNQMEVEEYYEQDYVSDNIQTFTNISGIAFSVQNNFLPQTVSGELYLDNIELY